MINSSNALPQPQRLSSSDSRTSDVNDAPRAQSIDPGHDLGPAYVAAPRGGPRSSDRSITRSPANKATPISPQVDTSVSDPQRSSARQANAPAGNNSVPSTSQVNGDSLHESSSLRDSSPDLLAMLDKFNAPLDQLSTHPQTCRQATFLLDLFRSLDAVRALSTGADSKIRQNPDIRERLEIARQVLAYMREIVEGTASSLPRPVSKKLAELFRIAETSLGDFSADSSALWRTAVLAAVRAINTFILLAVPIVEGQKKTTALYVGLAVKSALRAVGLAGRSTTHMRQIKDHFIGRDLINTQQNLLFALGLIPRVLSAGPVSKKLHSITHGSPYLAFVGVASVIVGSIAFHHREMACAANKLLYGSFNPNLEGQETFWDLFSRLFTELGRSSRDEGSAPSASANKAWRRQVYNMDAISPDVLQTLSHVLDVSSLASTGMSRLREEMAKMGPLSDSSNKTIGHAESAFESLHRALALVTGDEAPVKRANYDFVGKAFLAGLALAACISPVYFLKGNPIGFVDLIANATFVFLIMTMNAANRSTSLQTSEDDFGQFCGFSLAMIPVWGYNLRKGDPMELNWANAMKGSAVLAALGNIAASPLGKGAGLSAGKIARRFGGVSGSPRNVESTLPETSIQPRIRALPEEQPVLAANHSAQQMRVGDLPTGSRSLPPTVGGGLDFSGDFEIAEMDLVGPRRPPNSSTDGRIDSPALAAA